MTLGDRRKFDPAQDLASHIGKIVRINPDGSVPRDNPFVGRAGVRPEIWAYGIRNSQGATLHPQTGALWEVEHGPRGGDELNILEPGKNYGWPLVSWGIALQRPGHSQAADAAGSGAARSSNGPRSSRRPA